MKCIRPFVKDGAAYGCGQCLPCRVKRRREWTTRIMLEAGKYAESSFVTLTYSDGMLPICNVGLMTSTLLPADVRDWLKRLRTTCARIIPNWKLRFYLVGEYGDKSERPHYHAALFGFKGCIHGDVRLTRGGREGPECRCASCSIIAFTWPFGRIHQGVIERASAGYIAGYTVKRMTGWDDERLHGRCPEFARMSLRGGIGLSAMQDVADVYRRYDLEKKGRVETAVRVGKRVLPLGRYLTDALRRNLGVVKEGWKDEEVSALWAHYERIASEKGASAQFVADSVYKALREKNKGYAAKLEVREKLFKRGKS